MRKQATIIGSAERAAKAGLNRAILDAGWGELARTLRYKAARANKEAPPFRAVSSHFTAVLGKP